MLCSRSRNWRVFGLLAAVGCGSPDTVGTTDGSSSGEPVDSTMGIATSTDPGPLSTSGAALPTTSAGTGSASGTMGETTEVGSSSSAGSTSSDSDVTSGSTGDSGAPLCRPGADVDACSGCVAEQCNPGFCECMAAGDCLCVLGCLDSDSLAALLGCVLGECGLMDASLDNLTAVVTAALVPLDDCEALTSEDPAGCGMECPGLMVLP